MLQLTRLIKSCRRHDEGWLSPHQKMFLTINQEQAINQPNRNIIMSHGLEVKPCCSGLPEWYTDMTLYDFLDYVRVLISPDLF